MQVTNDVDPRSIMTAKFFDDHVRIVKSREQAGGLDQHIERTYDHRTSDRNDPKSKDFTSTVLFLNDRDLQALVGELTSQNDAFNRHLQALLQPEIDKASKAAMEQKVKAWNNQVTKRSERTTATDSQASVPPYPQFVVVDPEPSLKQPIVLKVDPPFTTKCVLGYGFRQGKETQQYLRGRLQYGVAKEDGVFKFNHLAGMIDT